MIKSNRREFIVHMADALLAPAVAVTMYVASGVPTGLSVRKLKKEEDMEKLPVMAVSAALVFAGQMVNYTIPGTGASGHLCGGMLLTALLGPWAGFLSMEVILAIQCLLFADGGLMALGANCWNMAFYGCFVGYYLIWRPIMCRKKAENRFFKGWAILCGSEKKKPEQKAKAEQKEKVEQKVKTEQKEKTEQKIMDRRRIIIASVLGCVVTLQMGAFSVAVETSLSGIAELPFFAFVALLQPIHLAIGLVEGLITAAVLVFVYEARPELIRDIKNGEENTPKKHSLKTVIVIIAVATALVGGGFSLLASGNPDGLEWALFGNAEAGYGENMGLTEEDYGLSGGMADAAEAIQKKTALLPDYAFAESDSAAGTSVSGLLGSVIVAGGVCGICILGGFFRKRRRVA